MGLKYTEGGIHYLEHSSSQTNFFGPLEVRDIKNLLYINTYLYRLKYVNILGLQGRMIFEDILNVERVETL